VHEAGRWDLIIVGGGIGGVISLKYALDAGLRTVLFEKEAGVGGLWRHLPAWQDIQFSKEEWALGDLPIAGEDQASVLANIEVWVQRFGLSPYLRLGEGVRVARPKDGEWEVETASGLHRARYLLAATGGQNRPYVPPVQRLESSVAEHHAATFRDPSVLREKEVLVVGGGASAFDLLDLCFLHGAAKVTWIHRSLKWMRPTLAAKQRGGMRRLAQVQLLRAPIPFLNRMMNRRLRAAYLEHGVEELLPDHPFDLRRDQLLPGRKVMLENFAHIVRHRGEIQSLEGGWAVLADGTRMKADVVLWGTGYQIDLRYLEVEALARQTRLEDVIPRCGALFRALDAPNLFLLAPGVLDTNGSTPWAYAHAAKSIMSHIRGGEVFGTRVEKHRPYYFDLLRFLASQDRRTYPRVRWRTPYFRQAFLDPRDQTLPLP
jgi:cation diffusion facilitator CzcD-associated flavoprotein CzcO